jgi:alkaline phosphatase D
MPLRRTAIPKGPDAQMYRSMEFGKLGSFFVLDTRQYRTDQPCGAGTKAPCAGVFDQSATIMGDKQERWLTSGLDSSAAKWNVIPQQVMIARVNEAAPPAERYSMDKWPGYEAQRQRLLSHFAMRRPSNPVVLSGDIHNNWVNDLQVDEKDEKSPVVATEFVGTSISSGGDGSTGEGRLTILQSRNPFVKYYNNQRGYVSCELTPDLMRAKYQCVDYVSKPGAPLVTRATFVVENGTPGAKRDS